MGHLRVLVYVNWVHKLRLQVGGRRVLWFGGGVQICHEFFDVACTRPLGGSLRWFRDPLAVQHHVTDTVGCCAVMQHRVGVPNARGEGPFGQTQKSSFCVVGCTGSELGEFITQSHKPCTDMDQLNVIQGMWPLSELGERFTVRSFHSV
jgi:hypothetical protein